MNITQLRDVITTLLGSSPNLIGSYILPDNTQIPAVYVVGQKSVPSEWKVTGMEVTISQYPEPLPGAPMGGTVKVQQLWEVALMQYNPDGKQVNEAMDRIVRRFPDCSLAFVRGNDVAYERCRVTIPDLILRPLYSS